MTNLFYWNNIVHDVFNGYGFDEASGNFQNKNYTGAPGGLDEVRAEAQDGSGGNNANFNTPADNGNANGTSRPRMQMFEWRSTQPNPIVISPPSAIAGTYFGPMAGFGQSLATTGPISGQVVAVTTAAPSASRHRPARSTTAASPTRCRPGRSRSFSVAPATSR